MRRRRPDIANWSWVCAHFWAGVPVDEFRHLQRWLAAIEVRAAVQAGVNVISRENFDLLTGRSGDAETLARDAFDLVQTGSRN